MGSGHPTEGVNFKTLSGWVQHMYFRKQVFPRDHSQFIKTAPTTDLFSLLSRNKKHGFLGGSTSYVEHPIETESITLHLLKARDNFLISVFDWILIYIFKFYVVFLLTIGGLYFLNIL